MELALPTHQIQLNQLLPPLEQATQAFARERLELLKNLNDGATLGKQLHIPFMPMATPKIPWQEMMKEAINLEQHFVPHRSEDSQGWKSLCLHGIHSTATRAPAEYGYSSEQEVPYVWTDAAEKSPITKAWVQSLVDQQWFSPLHRVRFMWLEPGGHILFHQDRPDGQNSLGPLNVALNMPDHCYWLFKKWGRVPFKDGTAFSVDVSYQHGVWNFSDEPRIHIIVHGKYGRNYYKALLDGAQRMRDEIKN